MVYFKLFVGRQKREEKNKQTNKQKKQVQKPLRKQAKTPKKTQKPLRNSNEELSHQSWKQIYKLT